MWYSDKTRSGIRAGLTGVVFLLCGLSLFAGNNDSLKMLWLEDLCHLRVSQIQDLENFRGHSEIPETWKENSAVVLLDYSHYFVENAGTAPVYGFYSQTRVLLKDQYAVNDFSSFTPDKDEWFEVRVYKKDGSVVHLDKSRAVSGDVRIYNEKKKVDFTYTTAIRIPVPNLEIGDVIEYVRFWENIEIISKSTARRIPFVSRYSRNYLNETFPVLKRVIDMEISSPYYLKWQSLNGAPELQLRADNGTSKLYRFMDEKRDKIKGEYWSARRQELPLVKFSMQEAPKKTGPLVETGLNAYSADWFLAMAKEANNDYKNSHSGFYLSHDKGRMIPFKSERAVKEFYSEFRRRYFLIQKDPDAEFDNYTFIITMARLLKKWKLEYQLVMAVPKEYGTIDQVISPSEIYWALRLEESGTILGEFNAFSTLDEWQNTIRGTKAYFADFNGENKRSGKIYKEQIPNQKPAENSYKYNLDVNVFENELKVRRTHTYTGMARYENMRDLPHYIFDQDYQVIYGSNYEMGLVPYYAFRDQKNIKGDLEELARRYWKDQYRISSRYLGKSLNNPYYEVVDYKLLEIRDGARDAIRPMLVYEEEFEAKGLVARADSTLVLNIGRLLGSSFTIIDSEDSLRFTGIDYQLPKKVEYILYFNKPKGYTYTGIEQFDTTLSNATGSYEVRSKEGEDGFTLYATRIYSASYFDKSHWPEALELLELAGYIHSKHIILTRVPE